MDKTENSGQEKVVCPHCGYEMPIFYEKDAVSSGVFVFCKGRKCRKKFEIKLPMTK